MRSLQDRVCVWIEGIRDRTVAPAVSWTVRHVWSTLAGAAALVLFSLLLLLSEAVRVIVFDPEMGPAANVQVDLRLPAGHTVRDHPRRRRAGRGRRLRDERAAPWGVHPRRQRCRRQRRVAANGHRGVQRQPPGRRAAPSERAAHPPGVSRGDRAGLAREHRRAPAPGADAVPDHVHSDRAERRLRA